MMIDVDTRRNDRNTQQVSERLLKSLFGVVLSVPFSQLLGDVTIVSEGGAALRTSTAVSIFYNEVSKNM